MAAEHGEKTEAPTPRRRQEARERGQVARSTELTAAAMLVGGLLALRLFGPMSVEALHGMLSAVLSDGAPAATRADDLTRVTALSLRAMALAAAPIMLALVVLSVVANMTQTGPLVSWHPLRPQWSRINPLAGVSRLFSLRSAVQLAVNLMKLALVGYVAYDAIRSDMPLILAAVEAQHGTLLSLMASMCFSLGIKIAVLLLGLALLDFGYHRWQHERDLRMTKDEVKEEMKRMEGDPLLKHRRRQIQMQLAAQRLRRDVPKADVVVTNPTELAIALRYDEKTMRAPTVIAKGAGYLAQRIREIAREHRIPIVERKPLAQALYKTVEVGQEVPPALYKAVAEILAYVYELTGRAARRKAG
ncbi:MAG: flagellar biosynthesis protein FlhB [Phycisphaerae bacterium]|nr:flagellar biosynthesis protein FlhB [Phycisphaerae bacterium]NUQ45738.1 flagellar biosynthesis protein FlhB [Phycisphaerae bacterium]